MVFSSRQGRNFLSNCPFLLSTATHYNYNNWTVANILQFSSQTATRNALVSLYEQNWEQLKAKMQPHRDVSSQNAKGTMTIDRDRRWGNMGQCLPLAAFPAIIFVSAIEIPLRGGEPHSWVLICYASGSGDTLLNPDKTRTFWKSPLKNTGTLEPVF